LLVRELAHTAQVSHQEELSSLLRVEEAYGRRHGSCGARTFRAAPRRPSPRQSLPPRRDATGIAWLDKGALCLLSDMIAEVHQGDMIIPTGPAVTVRGMMGGSSVAAGKVHDHHLLASRLSTAFLLPR
jgi:hypothetical protein